MPTSATGTAEHPGPAPGRAGYTLVEVLVVVVITGILTGLVILRVGDFRPDPPARQLDRMAAQLAAWCELAILQGRVLGLRISSEGYDFWTPEYLQDGIRWLPLQDNPAFPEGRWQGTHHLTLTVQDSPAPLDADDPQLRCQGSGQLTPFTLSLEAAGRRSVLSGHSDGRLQLRE